MEILKIIGWCIWLVFSLFILFEFVGLARMLQMFPEGKRWWILPAQWITIINFTVAVLCHPVQ